MICQRIVKLLCIITHLHLSTYSFRARVATNHLEQKATGWTVQDCKDLQMNVYSMHGKLFVDLLREAKFDLNKLFDPAYRINSNYEVMATALGVLFDWNYELDAGSTGACVYEVWIYCLMHTIFGTGLKKAYMQKNDTATDEQAEVATSLILGFLKGDPFNETLKVKNEIGTFSHSALLRILSQDACGEQWSSFKSMPGQAEAWKERPTGWKPSNYWLDTCGGFDAVLLRTLMQVVKICGARFGPQAEVSSWTWGGMHALNLKHALSKRLGPDPFDCGAYPIGGDMLTLNLASSSLDGTFDACRVAGVSWRLVVDFSDMQNSQWMMPCGNSGHVSSPHYNDLTDRFLAGQFERAIMDAGELAESGKEMMVLRLTSTAATTGLVREERSERSKRKKKNPIAKPLLTLVAIIALFLWLAYSAGVDWVAAVESVGAYAWKLVLDPMHPLRGWIVGGDCDADHPGL
jgi:acyl-homoserine lactone acylase PvdQ